MKPPANVDDATAQAYGARQFELVGISLQRGSLICLTAFLLLLPVWLNFEPLMIAMGTQIRLACQCNFR
jgi:Na+-driven multidrug efflux pump